MSSLLYRLGRFCARRARWVIAVWLAALVAIGAGAIFWGGTLEDDFSIPGSPSQQGLDTLEARFPQASGASAQLVYGAPEGERITAAPYRGAVERALEAVRDVELVSDVDDPFDRESAISPDGAYALVTVQFDVPFGDLPTDVLSDVETAAQADGGVSVHFGGQAYSSRGVSLSPTEAVGIVIAFFVLFVTFGSALAAGIPLVMTLVGVGVSFAGILLVAAATPVSTATPSLALMIGLAVGIDYGLFIISRHRSELAAGAPVHEAIGRSLATAGSAVSFAGATVIIALAGLSVAGIPFLSIMGLAAALTVALAMLSTLTLLPSLLTAFGEHLRPKERRTRRRQTRVGTLWVGVTKRHPVATVFASSAVLLVLLVPAASLRLALNDNGDADPGSAARETYDLIAQEFGPGYNAPLVVTADIITSTDPIGVVDAIEADLARVDGVAAITRATPNPGVDLALFRVIPEHAQGDEATIDLVHELRALAPQIEEEHRVTDVTVTGITAVSIDTSERLTSALLPFAVIVAGLSFLLSLLVFRSVAIPLKATLGFVLSASAAFGAVSAIYSWGWLTEFLNVQATGPVISFFPIMTISVLFGLSMDYEVFLVARIREEYVRNGDAERAIDMGYQQSQTVVNAAGLIMVAVFVAFIPHGSATIKPIAIGLAVGVFVDAFIVRMTLARAILYLLGDRAWWLPRWLDQRLPHLDVEGAAVEANVHVQERSAVEGDRAIRSESPPLDVRPGERAWYFEPDDAVRREFMAAVAGWTESPRELTVLGQAMPFGRSAVRGAVALSTSQPFSDLVPPDVDAVGVAQRYLLARGLRRRPSAELLRMIADGGLPRERAQWTLLEKRMFDVVLAGAAGVQLLLVDDLDVCLVPAESAALADAAVRSGARTVLLAAREPLPVTTERAVAR
ncbi:MMPL family transporter [Quadrisphaera sp. GCM10027208]|uniref:MMPL family transporter n=1 Tax=Quadrisphaera sp. GCM10027208 TaxID=3273423 RepID=UPI003613450E